MLRKVLSLILLSGFLAVGLAGPTLAAPQEQELKIYDQSGRERYSYQIRSDQGKTIYTIYVSLTNKPDKEIEFLVCSTGYLVFHLAGGDFERDSSGNCNQMIGFYMDQRNYQSRPIILEYQGNPSGESNKKGKVIVKNDALNLRKEVNFVISASADEDEPEKNDQAKKPSGNPNAGAIDLSKIKGSPLTLDQVFTRAVGGVFWLIAFLAFLALIVGGMQYITAGGDAGRAAQARKTIIWSLIGVVVALVSYVLVRFIAGLIGR